MAYSRLFLVLVPVIALTACSRSPSLPALSNVPRCDGAPAGTLYVDGGVDSSGDGSSLEAAFKTLTEAVAASSPDGHICIIPGTYQEGSQVVLDKNLVLEGATIPSDTSARAILHGQDAYRVLFVDDSVVEPVVVLENLVITHGLSDDALDYGGGIQNLGDLTLLNTSVKDNYSTDDSGAIENQGTLVLGAGTVISGNTAEGNGGSGYNDGGLVTVMAGAIVKDNQADESGGAFYNSGTMTVQGGAEIIDNTADDSGGAIYNSDTLTLEANSEISGNTAGTDGGGVYNSMSLTIAAGTIVTGNTANTSGGGFTGGGIYNDGTFTAGSDTSGVTGNDPDDVAP